MSEVCLEFEGWVGCGDAGALLSVDGFESEVVSMTDMSLLDVSKGDCEWLDLGDEVAFLVFLGGAAVGEDILRLGFPMTLSNWASALVIIGNVDAGDEVMDR